MQFDRTPLLVFCLVFLTTVATVWIYSWRAEAAGNPIPQPESVDTELPPIPQDVNISTGQPDYRPEDMSESQRYWRVVAYPIAIANMTRTSNQLTVTFASREN